MSIDAFEMLIDKSKEILSAIKDKESAKDYARKASETVEIFRNLCRFEKDRLFV